MEEVTLIVKAPNQQVADQRVRAAPCWTISRLKGHLAEVYPCRPKLEEQKLIYSGKLLPDTVVLKDVLRTYEGQDTHTVHLVCTPRQAKYGNSSKSTTPPPQPEAASSSSSQSAPSPPVNNSDDGLRQRHVTDSSPTNNNQQNANVNNSYQYNPYMPYMNQEQLNAWNAQYRQWAEAGNNMFQTSGANLNAAVPNMQMLGNINPMMFAAQIAWMQQIRMQQMQQYYSLPGVTPSPLYNWDPQMPGINWYQTQDNTNIQPSNNVQQPAQQEAAVAAPQNVNNEAEVENRDWLGWAYDVGRWFLMCLVVYFYSNPMRIFTVLMLGAIMHLFQARFHHDPQNEQQQNLADNLNNNYQQQQDNNNERVPNNAAVDADNVVDQNQENVQLINNHAAANEESFLQMMWTAFMSFFSSLIPEVPNGRN